MQCSCVCWCSGVHLCTCTFMHTQAYLCRHADTRTQLSLSSHAPSHSTRCSQHEHMDKPWTVDCRAGPSGFPGDLCRALGITDSLKSQGPHQGHPCWGLPSFPMKPHPPALALSPPGLFHMPPCWAPASGPLTRVLAT